MARKVFARVDDFVVTAVDEETRRFHLAALLAHHMGRLGFVLVSLNLALELVGMVVGDLIGLGEGMVVSDAGAVVTETAEVGFGPLLLIDCYSNDFNLVVGHADFDLELVGHHKLVSFDRVVVIGLLLLVSLSIFSLHLLLLLLVLLVLQFKV